MAQSFSVCSMAQNEFLCRSLNKKLMFSFPGERGRGYIIGPFKEVVLALVPGKGWAVSLGGCSRQPFSWCLAARQHGRAGGRAGGGGWLVVSPLVWVGIGTCNPLVRYIQSPGSVHAIPWSGTCNPLTDKNFGQQPHPGPLWWQ